MQVNLHDAKTHLSRYVDQALAGEEVVIARAGKPLVRLVPFQTQPAPRLGGFLRGQAILTADLKADFKAEIEEMFYGGPPCLSNSLRQQKTNSKVTSGLWSSAWSASGR